MLMTQVYSLANEVTKEVLGQEAIVQEDLSNVVDLGDQIANLNLLDNYVRSLVDHIGKMVFVNRPYSGTAPSLLMDSWEYGSILEKVTYDGLPDATENESWDLQDGEEYNPNIFTQPQVSAKFFDKRVTFEVPMSFAERQVKSAFSSAAQLNAFFSMIYNAIEKSMTVKIDGLVERTINNVIGETIGDANAGTRSVNLLSGYNTQYSKSLTATQAILDPEFIRYSAYMFKLFSDRMVKISTLFNAGGKERFTPKDMQKIIMLSEFKTAADVYLQSDTFHNEFTKLPEADEVAYWQGSGTGYDFQSTSAVKIKTAGGKTVSQAGILGVIFDRDCAGVSNLNRRVTTDWNAKGEFWNNWYKFDAGYFNDFNENAVVFHMGELEPTPAPTPTPSIAVSRGTKKGSSFSVR